MSGGGFHKKGGGEHGGGGEEVPLWYVSFSDMMAVLMAMFVMLYSMSNLDTTKFQEVVVSLNGAMGVLSGGPGVLFLADLPTNLPTADGSPSLSPLNVIQRQYAPQLQELASGGRIESQMTSEGLKLRFTDQTLFDPGSATLRAEADEVLAVVGELLRDSNARIAIEGHSDTTPIRTAQFPSNWELSTARATAVVHYLIEQEGIAPRRLTAAGYGEYWPIVPNDTPEGRAYNRRVEILLISEEEHETRPDGTLAPPKTTGSSSHTAVDLLAIPKELNGPGLASEDPSPVIGPPDPSTKPTHEPVAPETASPETSHH